MKAKDNPFRVDRLSMIRYRLAGTDWEDLMARLRGLGLRAAVVGPEGSGKTLLVEEIGVRLEASGCRCRREVLRRGQKALDGPQRHRLVDGVGPRDILVLDGAQELSFLSWRWLLWRSQKAGGLLVTSHRPGLLPTLLTCRTSPELLQEIVDELDPVGETPLPSAHELYARHGGNLRTALLEAYDLCASLPPDAGTPVPASSASDTVDPLPDRPRRAR